MTSRTQINVDIVGQYKGSQNIKKAQSEFTSLGTTVTKLAKAFGVTFAATELVNFGKAAVTAFAADDKSAKILANTLSNLGQSFADVPIEKFITNLSEVNGIAKTDLRTAFDTLVRSTGDATKSQQLLNLGLDISAGTGKDLASVTMALGKAYGGNNTALARLGAGLTKAQLKTLSFAQLTDVLSAKFKGDASTAADTYAGKIARIKQSFEEFKITIGQGLVDAFSALGNNGSITGLQTSMDNVAKDVANMVVGLGVAAGYAVGLSKTLNGIFGGALGKLLSFSFTNSILGQLTKIGKAKTDATASIAKTNSYHDSISGTNAAIAGAKKLAAAQATSNAANLAAANKIAAAAKATLQAQRDALSLKLAGNTTDMQNIEIQAALQRGQTQQVNDVLLLQRAILSGNADQANILAQEVLKANGLVMDVNGNISSLANATDPFKDWPPATASAMAQLKAIQDALAALKDKTVTVTINTATSTNGVQLPANQVTTTAAGTTGTGGLLLPNGAIAGVTDAQGNQFFAPAPGAPSISGIARQADYQTLSSVDPLSSVMPSQIGGSAPASTSTGMNYLQPMTVVLTVDSTVLAQATVNPSASGVSNSFSRQLIF